jgi:hypothetical protein
MWGRLVMMIKDNHTRINYTAKWMVTLQAISVSSSNRCNFLMSSKVVLFSFPLDVLNRANGSAWYSSGNVHHAISARGAGNPHSMMI